jgi:hypothetical protein
MADDAGGAVAAANVLLVPVQHLDKAAEEHQEEATSTQKAKQPRAPAWLLGLHCIGFYNACQNPWRSFTL